MYALTLITGLNIQKEIQNIANSSISGHHRELRSVSAN